MVTNTKAQKKEYKEFTHCLREKYYYLQIMTNIKKYKY